MLLKPVPLEGKFYVDGTNRYIKFESDGNGGTRYVLDTGKSATLPLVSRAKVKEVVSEIIGRPVQPVFIGL